MKRKYPRSSPQKVEAKSFRFFAIRDGVIALFVLELLVALEVPLPHSFVVVAPVFAAVAGGLLVFFDVMATLFEPLHRNRRTIVRKIDSVGCFVLFVISLFGVFFDPVPQFVLWVNVLILSRWLYDAIATYVDEWRVKNKRRLTDADCPDKIERPGSGRD